MANLSFTQARDDLRVDGKIYSNKKEVSLRGHVHKAQDLIGLDKFISDYITQGKLKDISVSNSAKLNGHDETYFYNTNKTLFEQNTNSDYNPAEFLYCKTYETKFTIQTNNLNNRFNNCHNITPDNAVDIITTTYGNQTPNNATVKYIKEYLPGEHYLGLNIDTLGNVNMNDIRYRTTSKVLTDYNIIKSDDIIIKYGDSPVPNNYNYFKIISDVLTIADISNHNPSNMFYNNEVQGEFLGVKAIATFNFNKYDIPDILQLNELVDIFIPNGIGVCFKDTIYPDEFNGIFLKYNTSGLYLFSSNSSVNYDSISNTVQMNNTSITPFGIYFTCTINNLKNMAVLLNEPSTTILACTDNILIRPNDIEDFKNVKAYTFSNDIPITNILKRILMSSTDSNYKNLGQIIANSKDGLLGKINGTAYNGINDVTIAAAANGGNASTVGGLSSDNFVLKSEVGNEANKIPRFSSEGHLVFPDGHEEYNSNE